MLAIRLAPAALLASFIIAAPAFAGSFRDVPAAYKHATAIEYVKDQGIVQGYADGRFKPDATINRAEFTKIIVEATVGEQNRSYCFTDVRDEWFASFVCTAKDKGFLGGYPDGTFLPSSDISFVEAAKIITKAFGLYLPKSDGTWYGQYVASLERLNAIPLDIGSLSQPVTRGQMAEMIYRIHSETTTEPSRTYADLRDDSDTEYVPSHDDDENDVPYAPAPSVSTNGWQRFYNDAFDYCLLTPQGTQINSGYLGYPEKGPNVRFDDMELEIERNQTLAAWPLGEYADRLWRTNVDDDNPNIQGKVVGDLKKTSIDGKLAYRFTLTQSYSDGPNGGYLLDEENAFYVFELGGKKFLVRFPTRLEATWLASLWSLRSGRCG